MAIGFYNINNLKLARFTDQRQARSLGQFHLLGDRLSGRHRGIGAIGLLFPDSPMAWTLALFFAQFITMTIRNGELGSLWPLGMLLFAVLALPGLVAAKLASVICTPGGENRS